MSPQSEEWKIAINEELTSVNNRNTWEIRRKMLIVLDANGYIKLKHIQQEK